MDLERGGWTWPPHQPKDEWGPRGWNWAHVTAINYPQSPSRAEAQRAFRRFWSFVSHLPCAACMAHSQQYFLSNPPYLASSYALQSWVWRFHNAVNSRLGKPVISYDEYLRLYADEIHWAEN